MFPFAAAAASVAALRGAGTAALAGAGTTGDAANRVELDADGGIRFGPGNAPVDTLGLYRTGPGDVQVGGGLGVGGGVTGTGTGGFFSPVNGGVDIVTAGYGLQVREGANAKQGVAVLVGGTVTVPNSSVTASSRILYARAAAGGGVLGNLSCAQVAGTSFTITSSVVTDVSTVVWEIFEPG